MTAARAAVISSLFYFAVFFFVLLNTITNQNQNLAVGGASLIVCHNVQLIQHFLVNSDGKALDRHKITPKQI